MVGKKNTALTTLLLNVSLVFLSEKGGKRFSNEGSDSPQKKAKIEEEMFENNEVLQEESEKSVEKVESVTSDS